MLAATVLGCTRERAPVPGCVDCDGVHPVGFLDEASGDFHGTVLAERGWDLDTCARCHGDDFTGGTSHVACTDCHAAGPTACVTCHGTEGPTSAAHLSHRAAGEPCAACHVVPARWDAPGHIVDDAPPAEVTFGARAALTPVALDRDGPPTYEAGSCANIYCHGDALHAPGGSLTEPVWTMAMGPACGSCHGTPPPSHAQGAPCSACHPADAPHIDGITQVGSTAGCNGCHGDASSPAPPRALDGATITTALGVGAHRAHLDVPSGLRAPIPCVTCHVVPVALDTVGHIDSPLPAEVDAALGWDRSAATCSTAWCHGDARPRWTEQGGAACGTCHGVPPTTAPHLATHGLADCVTCHDGDHMDGAVDVR